MRKLFVFLGVVFTAIGSVVSAQEVDSMAPLQKSSWGDAKTSDTVEYIPEISLDMRGGFGQDFSGMDGRFYGDGLYLNIDGYISPNFSYSFNHRIASTAYTDNSGFNGTNWLTLTYEIGDFSITAGKDGIFLGSFEYDAADLDSYYEMNSIFYNNFDCWQWGISGGWYPAEGQSILAQISNSPLSGGFGNLYAYALAWRGEWDCYESYWSANLWQYDKGKFEKSLNLGNRFYIDDFTVDLEYMTRGVDASMFTDDFTLMVKPAYEWEWGRAFAKMGLEKSPLLEDADSNIFFGAGTEFFPLKENKDIRLHAAWSYNEAYFGGHYLNLGIKWNLNITKTAKQLLSKL